MPKFHHHYAIVPQLIVNSSHGPTERCLVRDSITSDVIEAANTTRAFFASHKNVSISGTKD